MAIANPARPGFTAVELIMGLAITGLVLTALAAVMTSVAQGWRATEIAQAGAVGETAAMNRIAQTLRECRAVGSPATYSNGTTGVMLWMNDADGDGKKKISEMAALEFDPASRSVRVLKMNTTRYDIWSVLFNMLDEDMWASIRSLMGTMYQGKPDVTTRVLAENVKSARFQVHTEGSGAEQARRVEYTLVFERPIPGTSRQQRHILCGAATVRAPLE